ncbi:MAG: PTS glucose transporter subunit IIA, partial [Hungatella sp.]
LLLDNGVELLIHIGIDTVKLEGNYFKKYVEEGTHLKKGTKIVSFDLEKIKESGYDTTVLAVVGNTFDYKEVSGIPTQHADMDSTVIKVVQNV